MNVPAVADSAMAVEALPPEVAAPLRERFRFRLTQTGEGKGHASVHGDGALGRPVLRTHTRTGASQLRLLEFEPLAATPAALAGAR